MQQRDGIRKGKGDQGTELFVQCSTRLQAMWHVGEAVPLTFATAHHIVWFMDSGQTLVQASELMDMVNIQEL